MGEWRDRHSRTQPLLDPEAPEPTETYPTLELTDDPLLVTHNGKARRLAGRLTYPSPPELGAVVGPAWTREYLVVLGTIEGVTYLGYATTADHEAAARREAPASLIEANTRAAVQRGVRGRWSAGGTR